MPEGLIRANHVAQGRYQEQPERNQRKRGEEGNRAGHESARIARESLLGPGQQGPRFAEQVSHRSPPRSCRGSLRKSRAAPPLLGLSLVPLDRARTGTATSIPEEPAKEKIRRQSSGRLSSWQDEVRIPAHRSTKGTADPLLNVQGLGWIQMLSALVLSLLAAAALATEGPPKTHTIPDVPLVAQTADWCGPAALAAVLQYHGEEITPDQIAQEVYLPDYRGALNLDLLLYARRRGFEAWAGEGSVHRITGAVCRNRPVICMVRRGNPLAQRNHFLVVTPESL